MNALSVLGLVAAVLVLAVAAFLILYGVTNKSEL
jgi:hypothetical protein